MDWAVITIIIQLIFLEGILSIDNAAVLGAMVVPLPDDQPVPWPRSLRWLGRRLDPVLGLQRMAALKVGLLGAYLGRGLMLLLASFVIQNLWLRVLGAFYLLYLALDYLGELGHEQARERKGHAAISGSANFWSIVFALEMADLAFSLDNVVAAVALSDRYWVVLLGVALGILTMRFAAGIFSRMIEWEPALQHAAYLLILAIGVELILEDLFHFHLGELTQFGISLGILLLTIAFARVAWLRPLNVLWRPLLAAAAVLQTAIRWLTWPFRYAVGSIMKRRSGALVPPR